MPPKKPKNKTKRPTGVTDKYMRNVMVDTLEGRKPNPLKRGPGKDEMSGGVKGWGSAATPATPKKRTPKKTTKTVHKTTYNPKHTPKRYDSQRKTRTH